jgi:hypothetical protein
VTAVRVVVRTLEVNVVVDVAVVEYELVVAADVVLDVSSATAVSATAGCSGAFAR